MQHVVLELMDLLVLVHGLVVLPVTKRAVQGSVLKMTLANSHLQ
jgi:hypothetical protein